MLIRPLAAHVYNTFSEELVSDPVSSVAVTVYIDATRYICILIGVRCARSKYNQDISRQLVIMYLSTRSNLVRGENHWKPIKRRWRGLKPAPQSGDIYRQSSITVHAPPGGKELYTYRMETLISLTSSLTGRTMSWREQLPLSTWSLIIVVRTSSPAATSMSAAVAASSRWRGLRIGWLAD